MALRNISKAYLQKKRDKFKCWNCHKMLGKKVYWNIQYNHIRTMTRHLWSQESPAPDISQTSLFQNHEPLNQRLNQKGQSYCLQVIYSFNIYQYPDSNQTQQSATHYHRYTRPGLETLHMGQDYEQIHPKPVTKEELMQDLDISSSHSSISFSDTVCLNKLNEQQVIAVKL